MHLDQPNFEAHFYKTPDGSIGVEVKSIQGNILVLRAYLLSHYVRAFPRTHTFALLTILDAPGTPSDLLVQINPTFSHQVIEKSHINLSNKLIDCFEVSHFSHLKYNPLLWKEDRYKQYEFDQSTPVKDYQDLMQGTFTIRVKDTKLLSHLKVGMKWKLNAYETSAFWYLENQEAKPSTYLALYKTVGKKWMYHAGETGTKGKRYPMKGMSSSYRLIALKLKAEAWIEEKIKDDDYQLIYKNYDTAFGIEEELRDE